MMMLLRRGTTQSVAGAAVQILAGRMTSFNGHYLLRVVAYTGVLLLTESECGK